jgi:hypothetical protein
MDGWEVELLYQDRITNKKGHSVGTYHNRVRMVYVLDTCTKYPIGYAIGKRENSELIKEALKNAVNHSRELFGQRYAVRQLQSDNFGKGTIREICDAGFAKYYTPAEAGNAKAKIIEPNNRAINNKYCRIIGSIYGNWSGYGVRSKKEKQPNPDLINMNRENFPDYDGVCRQIDAMMALWRADKIDEYRALFEKMPKEMQIPMTDENYLMIFGQNNGQKQLLQHSGLTLTIDGQKYDYDCFDVNFRRHSYTRWEVRYDTADLSKALAVNEDESLRFVLDKKHENSENFTEQTDEDVASKKRVNDYNEQLKQHIINTHEKYTGFAEGKTPALIDSFHADGTLEKLMIIDSRGQHKEQKYLERSLLNPPQEDFKASQVFAEVEEEECVFDGY